MDEITRGQLEKLVDYWLEERRQIVETVKWVQEEMPIKSLRDLALGFMVGGIRMTGLAFSAFDSSKEEDTVEEIEKIIRRRLPEILRKINRELGV